MDAPDNRIERYRPRRALKWAGTVACLLILAGFLTTLRWPYIAMNFPRTSVGLSDGSFYVEWGLMLEPAGSPPFEVYPSQGWVSLSDYALIARWGSAGPVRFATCPLWIPFVLLGIPAAILWRLDRRRSTAGACRCGYDLTGNTSGRCPECGQLVEKFA